MGAAERQCYKDELTSELQVDKPINRHRREPCNQSILLSEIKLHSTTLSYILTYLSAGLNGATSAYGTLSPIILLVESRD